MNNEYIKIVEDLALCEEHLSDCLAKTHLVDDSFRCKCFDEDYYNFDNMIAMARKCLKDYPQPNNIETLKSENLKLTQENNALKWAIFDHLGMVTKSGYDVDHFCPAMVKLFKKVSDDN